MDIAPKIIIIAERDCCPTTTAWMDRIQLFAQHLHLFPHVLLQIRAKTQPSLRWDALANIPHHPQVVVNGSPLEYSLARMEMMHFPQRDAPSTRPFFPFGMSIHHPTDPYRYEHLRPLYYQLGPIFSPLSKEGAGKGCTLISQTRKHTSTPIVAVGGITPESIANVLEAGAQGVASSGYLMRHPKPISALTELGNQMDIW